MGNKLSVAHPGILGVFPPDKECKEDQTVLGVCSKLYKELVAQKKYIVSAANDPDNNSVSYIAGKRIEIYMEENEDEAITATLFDKLLHDAVPLLSRQSFLVMLTEYLRTKTGKREDAFDTFSILLSYGTCPAQIEHMDVGKNLAQISMILSTETTPGVVFAESYFCPKVLASVWPCAPKSLLEMANENPEVGRLLTTYGSLLRNRRMSQPGHFEFGTVTKLQGGIVHGGPASTQLCRAVLFATAVPVGTPPDERYNPNVQFNPASLVHCIAAELWVEADKEARRFLLERATCEACSLMNTAGSVSDNLGMNRPEQSPFVDMMEKKILPLAKKRFSAKDVNRKVAKAKFDLLLAQPKVKDWIENSLQDNKFMERP